MSSGNNGGPAFPVESGRIGVFTGKVEDTAGTGMTLRDYFAGQVVAGFVSNPGLCRKATEEAVRNKKDFVDSYAECVYALADAMLKAREA